MAFFFEEGHSQVENNPKAFSRQPRKDEEERKIPVSRCRKWSLLRTKCEVASGRYDFKSQLPNKLFVGNLSAL